MMESVEMIKPILAGNTLIMIVFTMTICFTKDITNSKPWVGFAGVVSTLMATFAAYGGLVLAGASFTNFNYGAIFVLIGVGRLRSLSYSCYLFWTLKEANWGSIQSSNPYVLFRIEIIFCRMCIFWTSYSFCGLENNLDFLGKNQLLNVCCFGESIKLKLNVYFQDWTTRS